MKPLRVSRHVALLHDILLEGLVAYGVDRDTATHSLHHAANIANKYTRAATNFNHIIRDCTRERCANPPRRIDNARQLKQHLEEVSSLFADLGTTTYSTLELLIDHRDDIIQRADSSDALARAAEKLFTTPVQMVRCATDDIVGLVNEYTSDYPLDFLRLVADISAQLNPDLLATFGDELHDRLIATASDSFVSETLALYARRKEMVPYVDHLRKGHFTTPDRDWIVERGHELHQLTQGRARREHLALISAIERASSADMEHIRTQVARDRAGWPAVAQLYDETTAQDAASSLILFGDKIGIVAKLINDCGVPRHLATEAAQYFDDRHESTERVIDTLFRANHHNELFRRVALKAPELYGSPHDLLALIDGKEWGVKVDAYARYHGSEAKRAILLQHAHERPAAKTKYLIKLLDGVDDHAVEAAYASGTTIDDTIAKLRMPTPLPVIKMPPTPEHLLLEYTGALSILAGFEEIDHVTDVLRQVYVAPVKGSIVHNPGIIRAMARDALTSGHANARLIDKQEQYAHDSYRHLVQHYFSSSPTLPDRSRSSARRIIFIGDRLRQEDLESIAHDLGVAFVHLSQETRLGRIRQMITADDCIAYYLAQCGHSHSGPVKWMAQARDARFVGLHQTSPAYVRSELLGRIA